MGLAKGDATRVSIWVMASGGVLARTVFRSPSTTGPLPSLSIISQRTRVPLVWQFIRVGVYYERENEKNKLQGWRFSISRE